MKEGLLALPSMGPGGCRVQIFQDKDLSEFSLLSIGQFCDAGCTAHYDKTTVWITDDKGITIITTSIQACTWSTCTILTHALHRKQWPRLSFPLTL